MSMRHVGEWITGLGVVTALLTSCGGPESSTQGQPARSNAESSPSSSATAPLGQPTSLPPAAVLTSRAGGKVTAEDGAYCWATGPGNQATCNAKVFRDPAMALGVPAGETLTLRFLREGIPVELVGHVQNRPDEPEPSAVPIAVGNPTTFTMGRAAGTYWLDVDSKWPEGSVIHTFKLEVG
jgi:hypothetical protein